MASYHSGDGWYLEQTYNYYTISLEGGAPLDPGWARRLCSGSLLQFVTREDFFENDIPSLGFYAHREYALLDCHGERGLLARAGE